ncbi:hypothetical protein HK101_006729, partial [Irineochytrium annulatum]
ADDPWCVICPQCRDRLVAVCDFYDFIRHVRQGLYSTRRSEDLWMEVVQLKRRMWYARVGAAGWAGNEGMRRRGVGLASRLVRPDSQLLRDFEMESATKGAPPAVPAAAGGAGNRMSMSAQFMRFINGESLGGEAPPLPTEKVAEKVEAVKEEAAPPVSELRPPPNALLSGGLQVRLA